MNLHQAVKMVRHSNAVAVGATDIEPPAGIDMAASISFRTCLFMVLFGSITDAPSIKVQQSDDDGDADSWGDLAGTSVAVAADADNKITWVEVKNPRKRFVRCVVVRPGATGCVVDGIVAILGSPDRQPVVQPASVAGGEFHDSPAEGTA